MSLTLFQDKGFSGKSAYLKTSAKDLWNYPGMNDSTSSVRVHEGEWELYYGTNYSGKKTLVKPGDYDMDYLSKTVGNDQISSVKIINGLTLYAGGNFTGESVTISESKANLGAFDNRTTSIIVHNGNWMLYDTADYKGKSIKVEAGMFYDADYLINNLGGDSIISSLKKL